MTDEQIAPLIAQSNAALAATLAGVLHQFRAPLAPTIKLAKFMGHPVTAGDPTLVEWLDQFDVYACQAEVSDAREMPQLVCVRPLRWMQSSSKARWRGWNVRGAS